MLVAIAILIIVIALAWDQVADVATPIMLVARYPPLQIFLNNSSHLPSISSSISSPMSPSSSPTPLSSSDSPYIPLHQKTFLARAKARLATADSRQAKTFAAVELLLQFCTFYVFPSPPELGIGPLLFPKFCTNKHPGFCNHNVFNLHFANESFAFGQGVN